MERANIKLASLANQKLRPLAFAAIVIPALLLVGLLTFQDFVFGDKLLLYKDIGSDSINIFYPYYILRSDYLRHVGLFSWSFQIGMGQDLYPYLGTILISPIVLLPKAAIAHALVYQDLLYIVLAGLFFGRFLQLRGLNLASSLLGALVVSFSGYMAMGSCWYFHAYEVVCFSFLLFAAEQGIATGRWLYLSVAIVVLTFLGAFHLYLGAILLLLYVPFRLASRYPGRLRLTVRASSLLGAAAILGVALSAVLTISNLYAQLNSPRGSGLTSRVSDLSTRPIFGLESPLHYITALLRFYGNDMAGTGSDYHGWQNYLEAPMTYCGLVCLLIVPQIFVGLRRSGRVRCALLFATLLVPVIFPWFRYLFWAFQGDYYRTFSLFCIFAFVTLSMTTCTRYMNGESFNLWLLGGSFAVLAGVLFLPVPQLQAVIEPRLRFEAIAFLLGYTVLFSVGQILNRRQIVAWLVIGLTVFELVAFSRLTVATRPVVTKPELNERLGYNDETVDALHDIKATDAGFFRITKTWSSSPAQFAGLNDAMVFGYYSTASYSSFNNVNYVNFLISVDAVANEGLRSKTQWSLGLLRYPLLSTFAGEKYVLADEPEPYQSAGFYQLVRQYGKASLFRNEYFLPLGLAYTRSISEDAFAQLSRAARAEALLHAVVIPATDENHVGALTQLTGAQLANEMTSMQLPEAVDRLRATALHIESFRQNRIEGTIHAEAPSVLVVQTPFDRGWRAMQDGRSVPTLKVDGGLLGAVIEPGSHHIELYFLPPFLAVGGAITLLALVVLSFCLWRWPRLQIASAA